VSTYPKKLVIAGSIALWSALACGGLEDSVKPVPVPEDRKDYIGSWTSEQMDLTITADGHCTYEKRSKGGGGKTSLNAPIKAWHATGFDAGIGPLVTTFVVSKPPAKKKGAWTMTVDDVKLTRP